MRTEEHNLIALLVTFSIALTGFVVFLRRANRLLSINGERNEIEKRLSDLAKGISLKQNKIDRSENIINKDDASINILGHVAELCGYTHPTINRIHNWHIASDIYFYRIFLKCFFDEKTLTVFVIQLDFFHPARIYPLQVQWHQVVCGIMRTFGMDVDVHLAKNLKFLLHANSSPWGARGINET